MPNLNDLSERELEILNLLAEGKSNKDIANQLYISTNTVKVHLRNIFSKLEVTSRTEAVLFALRGKEAALPEETLSEPSTAQEAKSISPPVPLPIDATSTPQRLEDESKSPGQREVRTVFSKILMPGLVILLSIILLISTGVGLARYFQPNPTATPGPSDPTTPVDRWQFRSDLPIPKFGLAVVVYEEQIYAIGGENSQVLADVTRYNPGQDTWEMLPSKPTPVTEIQAVVAGGKIYVPGGKLENGQPTNILEIYDPHEGVWSTGTSLPTPLSAYALVAFEGDLYLFGGWDGTAFRNLVLRYDPETNEWHSQTEMTVARGFAGAVIAGGKIYVLGGYDGEKHLTNNDIYSPELEGLNESPWKEGPPIPSGRSGMGLAHVVDSIYLIGGESPGEEYFTQLRYSLSNNIWEVTSNPLAEPWAYMGVVPLGTDLYAIGGRIEGQPSKRNLVYQVIFSISIPIAP